jgi:hypothetical protein
MVVAGVTRPRATGARCDGEMGFEMGALSVLDASDGLRRLVMAELVRGYMVAEGEGEKAARLAKVTGYREHELVRYPGTSSTWTEDYVDVFWADDDQENYVYEWRGSMAELTEALERLVEAY